MGILDILKPNIEKKLTKLLEKNEIDKFIQEQVDVEVKNKVLSTIYLGNKEQLSYIFKYALTNPAYYIELSKIYQLNSINYRETLLNNLKNNQEDLNLILSFLKEQNNPITLEEIKLFSSNKELYNDLLVEFLKENPREILKIESKTDELIDLVISNGFVPTKEDLINNPEFCKNYNCMKKVLEENLENIIFDQTKDSRLYELVVDKNLSFTEEDFKKNPTLVNYQEVVKNSVLINEKTIKYLKDLDKELVIQLLERKTKNIYAYSSKYIKELTKQDIKLTEDHLFNELKISLESIKSTCNLLINNPKVPGKYQLPDKHIFESIKQFILLFPDEFDIDHNSLRLANAKLLNVNECNNYYNQEFGQEMERLYENEDILLGVAGSRDRTGTLEEFAKSFFEEGLLSNKEYHESLDRVIQMQVNEKGNIYTLADCLNYGYGSAKANFVFAIPKSSVYPISDNPLPLWKKNNDAICLDSSFIYGVFEEKNKDAFIYKNHNFSKPLNGEYLYNGTLGIEESVIVKDNQIISSNTLKKIN